MTLQTLVLRYTLFAVLATLANLGAQRLVLLLGEGALMFAIALLFGTGVGLVVKYILDKRWIFFDQSSDHAKKFTLYAAMGIMTTVIFWGTETAFWLIWQSHSMRELGAVLGLMVGYMVKYQLDRRFVFTDAALRGGVR